MSITYAKPVELPEHLRRYTNLADPRLGTHIVACSDEFFAEASRMLQRQPAIFVADKYDDNGKWMDGWETRRKRHAGYDWCIVRLGVPGRVSGVDIDTSFFTGNYPASASLEACYAPDEVLDEHTVWTEILPNQTLSPDQHHVSLIKHDTVITHLRLNIYPDGGIARLRVYGQVMHETATSGEVDLIALAQGGRVVAYSDAHYGHPENLLSPGRGINMGDGWETRRRRSPGHDWCIIALGQAGRVSRIEIDTAHFKGNFPAFCSIQAVYVEQATDAQLIPQSMFWQPLLPDQPLQMDHIHSYLSEILAHERISHVRINMIPDGGISRVRLWGQVV